MQHQNFKLSIAPVIYWPAVEFQLHLKAVMVATPRFELGTPSL